MGLLEAIENEIVGSPKIPVFNKLLVNEDNLYELLVNLKEDLPKQINYAKDIISKKDKILGKANQKSAEIVLNAQSKAKNLLNNNEILIKAKQESSSIREYLVNEIKEKEESADKYSDEVLEELENNINRALLEIKNGREKLTQMYT